jgi:hypothetical protein
MDFKETIDIGRYGQDSLDSEQGHVAGCCENSNGLSASLKFRRMS